MKRILTVMVALMAVACGGQQSVKTAGGAVFEISPEVLASRADTTVNIGTMTAGEVIKYDARIRNTGTEPLVIKRIYTSCGCTSVEYDREPIQPGGEATFSFRFDSRGMWGSQSKLVEIETSAGARRYRITIHAEVEQPAARNQTT
ncbi:MAG: DUF1573 domain-containing protein [Alistipes sp.]|jgi:hypothetical protein|nr:DUF1573 domain-containing protein [Alistipes sp.]